MLEHAFKGIKYIVLVHKGKFTIYLGKFRLTIGPEVLIPETLN
jgi:hypothetical protein